MPSRVTGDRLTTLSARIRAALRISDGAGGYRAQVCCLAWGLCLQFRGRA
jgi:hypothetical protein